MVFATEAINPALGYRPDDVVFCRFPMSWDYGLYKVLLTAAGRCEIVLADEESDLVPAAAHAGDRRHRRADRAVAGHDDRRRWPARDRGRTAAGAHVHQHRRRPAGGHHRRRCAHGLPRVRGGRPVRPDRVQAHHGHAAGQQDAERPSSVGLPLPGTRVLILDDERRPLPAGEAGEIVVDGPHVMPGYWRDARGDRHARSAPTRATGGTRLHTGDYGSVDDDGYLYFEGRRDDMFKRKGIRMSTLEIEAAAMDIPGVRAAAALPPDRPATTWRCSSRATSTPHVLLRELSQRLEPAKVPGDLPGGRRAPADRARQERPRPSS